MSRSKFDTIETKVVYPEKIMQSLQDSKLLDEQTKKFLRQYHSHSFSIGEQDHSQLGKLVCVEEKHQKLKTEYGRFKGSVGKGKNQLNWCSSSMYSPVRNLLFRDLYWDCDFVNCHFTIALQLFKRCGLPYENTQYYINNREECLQGVIELAGGEVFCNRDMAKTLFLRICYGGKIKSWCKDTMADNIKFQTGFYQDLQNEIHTNIKQLIDHHSDSDNSPYLYVKAYAQGVKDKTGDERDIYPATFAYICQDVERKLLVKLKEKAESEGYQIGALIFDGCHIFKNTEKPITDKVIKRWENYLETFGYPMKLKIKPMENADDDKYLQINDKESDKTSYAYVKKQFELTRFKNLKNGEFYEVYENPVDKIKMIQHFNRTTFNNKYEHLTFLKEETDKKGKINVTHCQFIKEWFKDSQMRVYEDVQFVPPPLQCPENVFNTWIGFKVETFNEEATDMELNQDNIIDGLVNTRQYDLDIILNHIKYISGGYKCIGYTDCKQYMELEPKQPECYEYVMNWFAQMVQQPAIKPEVCIILRSSIEGVGKTWWYDLQMRFLGSHLVCKIVDVERDLFGNFNSICDNKLFVFLEELDGGVSHKKRRCFLDAISGTSITINEKGKPQQEKSSYHRFYGATNNENPWKCPPNERRTFANEVVIDKAPPKEYFDNLYKATNNHSTLKKLYNHLMSMDISKWDPKQRPITEFYNNLKEMSIDPVQTWFKELMIEAVNTGIRKGYSLLQDRSGWDDGERQYEEKPSTKELMNNCIDFMKEQGLEYSTNVTKFAIKMKTFNFRGMEKYISNGISKYRLFPFQIIQDMLNQKWITQDVYDSMITEPKGLCENETEEI